MNIVKRINKQKNITFAKKLSENLSNDLSQSISSNNTLEIN